MAKSHKIAPSHKAKVPKVPAQTKWHIWHDGEPVDALIRPCVWKGSRLLYGHTQVGDAEVGVRHETASGEAYIASIYERGTKLCTRIWWRDKRGDWYVIEDFDLAGMVAMYKLSQ